METRCKTLRLLQSRVSSRCQTGAGIVSGTRLTLRVDFGPGRSIGPGKIRLLEAIKRTGSISQAGRTLGMSYRRPLVSFGHIKQWFQPAVLRALPRGSRGRRAARPRI